MVMNKEPSFFVLLRTLEMKAKDEIPLGPGVRHKCGRNIDVNPKHTVFVYSLYLSRF